MNQTKMAQRFEDLARQLGMSEDFHRRSIPRYIDTVQLALRHWEAGEGCSVAELGPGLLLPYVQQEAGCRAVGYGLMAGSWESDLNEMGIETTLWNFNEPLPDSIPRQQHDLVLFCEVIEHLNRWPVELLEDIRSLMEPGGTLIVSTVNFLRLSNRIRVLAGKSPLINKFERSPDGRNHIREYVLDELHYYLKQAGFGVDESRFATYPGPGASGPVYRLASKLWPAISNYIKIAAHRTNE